jgi:hypothetical protein
MENKITLDNDIVKILINKAIDDKAVVAILHLAIDSGKSSNLVNDALRSFLVINNKEKDVANNYPSSIVPEIQRLLNGLRNTIFDISKNGMYFYSKHRRWVSDPNVVTITVQDSRANSLRITVYGRPQEFEGIFAGINPPLNIDDDMSGYSRFILKNDSQLSYAIKVIQHSSNLKNNRGRR